jgi:hypothetical protein
MLDFQELLFGTNGEGFGFGHRYKSAIEARPQPVKLVYGLASPASGHPARRLPRRGHSLIFDFCGKNNEPSCIRSPPRESDIAFSSQCRLTWPCSGGAFFVAESLPGSDSTF